MTNFIYILAGVTLVAVLAFGIMSFVRTKKARENKEKSAMADHSEKIAKTPDEAQRTQAR